MWYNAIMKAGFARRDRWLRKKVELAIGRKLRRDEVVHHLNEDPGDNRLENLSVLPAAKHCKIHAATARLQYEHRLFLQEHADGGFLKDILWSRLCHLDLSEIAA